jgi:hypothetical protein
MSETLGSLRCIDRERVEMLLGAEDRRGLSGISFYEFLSVNMFLSFLAVEFHICALPNIS